MIYTIGGEETMAEETKRTRMIQDSAKPKMVPPEQSVSKKPDSDGKPANAKEG